MKKEIKVFFTALMFYTRIPCPSWVDHSEDQLNKATRYFPLMGWIVGGAAGGVFYAAQFAFPATISIIFSMVVSILITGAFHEDGFADVCDGFGGGWTKERILAIMKDSVIGAYGVAGLVIMLLTKFLILWELSKVIGSISMIYVMIAGHAISRFTATGMIFGYQYARDNDDSKAKPVAKKQPVSNFLIAAIFGILPMIAWQNWADLLSIFPLLLLLLYLGRYFKKWIGGYTGDCLGATQQLAEITFYLSFFVIWKFI
ncbi:MAG: adenosylcobinamide-GDP ribazoletransferase [Bacteroidota bacterium]